MVALIICEKPSVAKKIAEALGKPKKKSIYGVPYYELERNGKKILVASAVGHLFTLVEKKEGKFGEYPVFDIDWVPASIEEGKKYVENYIKALKKLSKEADEFYVATDWDIEGELIGYHALYYCCGKKNAKRMRFSSLTKKEIVKAFENPDTIDFGLVDAGDSRHKVDWYFGINVSRALMEAIRAVKRWKTMSTGRVQGPALAFLVERELEIKRFVPKPYWVISALLDEKLNATHEKEKFWDEKEANQVYKKIKDVKEGIVVEVKKRKKKIKPNPPFDLGTLQREAYRIYKFSPKKTQEIAQRLYEKSLCSYPRTSSQKLPKDKKYLEDVLSIIKNHPIYGKYAERILKENLKPIEGKKEDPAHPAIHIVDIPKEKLSEEEEKIYDLIARRTLAAFWDDAEREYCNITIDIGGEKFKLSGSRTVKEGWHEIYYFTKFDEIELPPLKKNEKIKVEKINIERKETKPPKRYTVASIIKELESRKLGTKCLTPNTLIKVEIDNIIKYIKIENLFELLNDRFKDGNVEFAINNKNIKCFSYDTDEIKSIFKYISKRKLEKNESVYKIEFEDGSFIEVTEEHPILIYDGDGEFKYIRAKDLKKGMKTISSIKYDDKEGDVICTWEKFIEICNEKSKLYGISEDIGKIREKLGMSKYKFAKKYGLSCSSVWKYEKNKRIPIYLFKKLDLKKPNYIASTNKNVIIKNPFPLKISSSLVRILAHLIGDGSIDKEKIKRENCYDFRYHNTNIDLIKQFVEDIERVFGIKLTIKKAKKRKNQKLKYYVQVPSVVGRIISILFKEVIEKNAPKIPKEFYPEFIGALFDDEGCAIEKEGKAFISNTNLELLKDVKEMLLELGIKSRIDEKQFKLFIKGRKNIQKFLNIIPFISVDKKQKLINALSNKYKWKDCSVVKKEKEIIKVLGLYGAIDLNELSKKTKLPASVVREYIKEFIKNGIVEEIVSDNKKIVYTLKIPPHKTFYRYIGEKVINKDFITKTISNIKKINYNGYVYDIINSEYSNFIANNIVVHNSTRAEIIDKLISRGYVVDDGSLRVTDLGIAVIETLKKFCPEIIDEKMTRDLEEKLELIQSGKIKKEDVLKEAEEKLREILKKFKEKEKEIGKELVSKIDSTNKKLKTIGKCKCGGDLVIIRTKDKKRFVGCTNYPECNITYSLPKKGRIKVLNETCESCGLPVIGIDGQKLCINPECPSKMPKENIEDLKESINNGKKICPKCGGKLVIKNGIYGAFLGCENYPKCKYTEKIKKNNGEVVGKCPKCGGDLVKKNGKYGEFIGCSNYPKCRYTEKFKK
ncbi:DNA topoisomerase I [Methanotorris igneus]|uniref:DNA topoisomerase 1 n=1 Tax=Methanotorris igneus (strain DSM 5666 / JCM 11834 / Kol 5) TaxID=880724 RepID=F6BCW5_METIK|nr:DNA topoisomerase I [Methanotorris igneus]AEF96326.1 DNA topoisomerase I [Methanotorris igneus Kol 5]